MLTDEERLKNERVKAQKTRERFQYSAGGSTRDHYPDDSTFSPSDSSHLSSSSSSKLPPEIEGVRPQSLNEEEIQLQIALAMSKEEADEEERRRQRDDVRLQLALNESQSEYQKHKPVQVSSKDELFDVFHQPTVDNNSSNGLDPWGNGMSGLSGIDGGGMSSDSFGTNGFNGASVADPWSAPLQGGGTRMQPAVSRMPTG